MALPGASSIPAAPAARLGPLPLAMLLALGTVWGLSFPVAKIVANHAVPALGYVAWQTVGAGTILLVVCLLRGTPPRRTWSRARYYAISGFCGIAFPNVVLQLAIAEMPAGIAAIIANDAADHLRARPGHRHGAVSLGCN